eukprot:jgi/Undpi1/6293/HiC_scaffold_20.g08777.m2
MGGEQQGPADFAYAYCHGFLSGPSSVKGQALRKTMLEAGVDMSLLNLNGEDSSDVGAITISGALKAVRQFHLDRKSTLGDPGLKLRLVGSSLGGYIVARYAEMYPKEVDRIFMLCPSFCLGTRATKFVSEAEMIEWERTGARVFPVSTGGEATVPWSFLQEATLQKDYPEYVCPAAIVHGLNDDVVPVASTRSLVEKRLELAKRTSAIFVEDDHSLLQPSTMALVSKTLTEFLDLRGEAVAKEDATAEEEKQWRTFPPAERNVEESLLAQGGKFVGEQVFTDVYWDTQRCGLTERDWWLRARAGRWELKMPAGDVGEEATAYKEITLASEIARELQVAGFLSASEARDIDTLCLDEGVLEAAGFEAFASFRTNREKYSLDRFSVDIDRASFGHQVVEIEQMSSPKMADIESARDSIAALARSLGAQREGASGRSVQGKLKEYIIRNCPKQLDILMRQPSIRGTGHSI